MIFTDSETKFVDKAGLDHTIDELKNYVMEQIANIDTGDIDLSDYVTQEQLQDALDALDIDIDLSSYATKEELQQAIASIDLSGYATTEYVDNAIANIPSGGNVDLSDYYTKEETYNKEEIDNLIPTVTDGEDGKDGEDGFSPTATVTKEGSTATITITDKNGTTTASISDGKDGTGGGGSGGGEVYSTEETEVGTWIDGKPIYRKTFVLEDTKANTAQFFDMNTEFDDIISINAINKYLEQNWKPLNMCEYDTYLNISSNSTSNIKDALTKKCMYTFITKSSNPLGRIYLWQGNNGGANYKVYVTIEYTKPIN